MNKIIKRSIKNRGVIGTIAYICGTAFYKVLIIILNIYFNNDKVRNNIIFFSSPDYSDNAKIFYEYLLKKYGNKYKFYWLVKSKDNIKKMPNTKFVKYTSPYHSGPSFAALYYVSKSRYVFYTHTSPIGGTKSKAEQVIINLWHGCGYKNDIKDTKSFIEKSYFDYVLVPGNVFIETKSTFFGCKKQQILPIGYPRYDILLNDNEKTKRKIKDIKKDNKLIIWMPTFRKSTDGFFDDTNSNSQYDIPLLSGDDELLRLDKICKNKRIILCIKKHPFQTNYQAEKRKLSNILFIDDNYLKKQNIELYSLLRYSDALITDYSSVAIDYLLLDKPIGFLLADFDQYSKTRGFVFNNPLEYMPGYHIYNIDELERMLYDISIGKDNYKKKRQQIINRVHNKCKNYNERIIKELFK